MTHITCCQLDEFLVAISDETRQRILALLRDREMSVNELTEHFALTQPTISHHLAILRRVRLVSTRHDGRQIFYRANAECVAACCRGILERFQIPAPAESAEGKS